MPTHRLERSTSALRQAISRIVSEELRDPAVAGIRVHDVVLSPDKKSALVQVAPWDPDAIGELGQEPLRALERASGYIRKALARELRMRLVPTLRFEYDRGETHARRIDTLLERIRKRSGKAAGTALAFLALQFGVAQAEAPLQRLESSAVIMGSEFRIACYAPSKKIAAGAITAAFAEVRRVDAFLSHYKPESELSRINREASRREIEVSREMADLLGRCLRYSAATDGAFDITVGALVRAWGFHRADGSLPGRWTLWRARRNTGYPFLRLDPVARTVRFLRSGLSLDPGGIGKGYAVDQAVKTLRGFGIERALVSSGTSSIFALGAPPQEQDGWRLTIREPERPGAKATTVSLADRSLSTSGSYETFFEVDGQRYSHILDPRTGRPASGVWAASVLAPLTIDSEAWATAVVVNGADWARRRALPDSRVFLCADNGDCDWLAAR